MYSIICKECGKEGQVPFQPRNPEDVLCADCFAKQKQAQPETKEEDKSSADAEPEQTA